MISVKKFSFIVTLCLLAAGRSLAQTSLPVDPPHGLVIIDLSLSRDAVSAPLSPPRQNEVTIPRGREDPNRDPVDKLRGPSTVPNTSKVQGRPSYIYGYSLKVKNIGEKKVRGVLWEYVAVDLANGDELKRRRFVNIEDVGHGKMVTLRAASSSPPTDVVTTGGLGQNDHTPFRSMAEIKCVLYADDTVWQAGGGGEYCAALREAYSQARAPKGNHP